MQKQISLVVLGLGILAVVLWTVRGPEGTPEATVVALKATGPGAAPALIAAEEPPPGSPTPTLSEKPAAPGRTIALNRDGSGGTAPVPTMEFERPCENQRMAWRRNRARRLLQTTLDAGGLSDWERDRFLVALYDAQEARFENEATGEIRDVDREFELGLRDFLTRDQIDRIRGASGGFPVLTGHIFRSRVLKNGQEAFDDARWFHAADLEYNCESVTREASRRAVDAFQDGHGGEGPADHCDAMARATEAVTFSVRVGGSLKVHHGAVRMLHMTVNRDEWPASLVNADALERCYREAYDQVRGRLDGTFSTHLSLRWNVQAKAASSAS